MDKPSTYKNHALSGDFVGFRDLHIEPDWLLLYQKKDTKDFPEGSLSIELTGTHADLF
jgi:mRNA interferase YafQ